MINTPVVVGVGDIRQKNNFDNLDEALVLMDKATKLAIKDSGKEDIKNYIEEVLIPKGFWRYRDPGKWIAKNNDFKDVKTSVSKIGILQQSLINSACMKIQSGEMQACLILGGESRYKITRALKEKKEFTETELVENPDYYIKANDELQTDIEKDSLGTMAVGYYSLFESALRHKKNKGFDNHHKYLSKIYENFSHIAVDNKDNLATKKYSSEEILKSSNKNPQIAFPYNKHHCTSWNVNQAAAIIICSEKLANMLNIDYEKRVYPIASSENNHMISSILRPELSKQAGMQIAADFIKKICSDNKINISHFDLYSCFPVAVQMFADTLGIKDASSMTITGGMSFAGGPLNSFVLHSSVQMIKKLRKDNNATGLVTGVSGMMTKQSYCLWSSNPIHKFIFKDVSKEASNIDIPHKISKNKNGTAKIIGYTIINDDRNIKKAVIYVEDESLERNIVQSHNTTVINSMEKEEWVGKIINFKNLQLIS